MSNRVLVLGTGLPTDAEFIRRKLLIDAGLEVVMVDSTNVEINGKTMELAVWDEIPLCVKETEKDIRPYYRKFEKRGKW